MIHRNHVEIEALMVERAMTIGISEYGDRAFHMTLDEIDVEAMEEAADLAMYEAVYDMREKGVIT